MSEQEEKRIVNAILQIPEQDRVSRMPCSTELNYLVNVCERLKLEKARAVVIDALDEALERELELRKERRAR